MSTVVAESRRVRLTSLGKVLWPQTGFAKGEMIDYYPRVAPALVPHPVGRPVTLGRFPDGVEGPGFAQNECRGPPDWLETVPVRLRSGQVRRYCLVDDLPSLLWVANLGTIELHPYLRRIERLGEPTGLVVDLDPAPPASLVGCCRVALAARELLASVRKVLVDWLQNDPMRSTVAPYSLRATPRPSVSTPVTWEEVEAGTGGESALAFGPGEVVDRLDRLGDLFAPVLELTQRPPEASAAQPRGRPRRAARR